MSLKTLGIFYGNCVSSILCVYMFVVQVVENVYDIVHKNHFLNIDILPAMVCFKIPVS